MSTAQSVSSKASLLGRIFQQTKGGSSDPNASSLPGKLIIPLGGRWATNEFRVKEGETGSRLDKLIMSRFDIPRSLLQKILRKGWIRLERPSHASEPDQVAEPHQIAKILPGASTKVSAGDVIRVSEVFLPEKPQQRKTLAELEASDPEAVAMIQETVLYKDDNVLVINKPAGLAVHGGPQLGENRRHLEAYLEALRFEKEEAPRIVHRLDRDTSGALLLARTRQAAAQLSERFQKAQVDSTVQKYYWAMVKGELPVKEGRIISNIYKAGEFPHERMTSLPDKRADVLDEGKVAITRFRQKGLYIRKVDGKRIKLNMVELQPLTGRTHQLRVHLAEQLDLPIIGDIKYGGRRALPGPLHLHSRKLIIQDYPEKGKFISVVAPIPEHFVRTMDQYPIFLRKIPKFPKKKLHNL